MISTPEKDLSKKSVESEVVLSVNGVSKKFCRDLKRSLFYGVQDMASELVGMRNATDKLRPQEFWALNDVSFELRRGEALGLVGKNGSGKSTLLRIIAGLIKPDAGSVEVKGRVAPLIALGAGFNPVLTGRENIYANMSILGLSKKEIDERFDQVVAFAEIGDAIDAPVRSYSSGMAARLGFSCAINTEPDILLVDEVLSVGDVKFRSKCHRKIQKLRNLGTAIILVSHNTQQLLTVCENAILLRYGIKIASGKSTLIMSEYEKDLFSCSVETSKGPFYLQPKPIIESHGADITYILFRDNQDHIIDSNPISGRKTKLCVGCIAHKNIENLSLAIKIQEIAGDGDSILFMSSYVDQKPLSIVKGKSEIQLVMPFLCLKSGNYILSLRLRGEALFMYDYFESYRFVVEAEESMSNCRFFQPRVWNVADFKVE